MGKIIRNGIEYSGTYDSATSVNYDNSVSGLDARTVQEGLDELSKGSKGAFPVDNLLSTATDIPLSANQGRVLDEKISTINESLEVFPKIVTATINASISKGGTKTFNLASYIPSGYKMLNVIVRANDYAFPYYNASNQIGTFVNRVYSSTSEVSISSPVTEWNNYDFVFIIFCEKN